MPISAVWGSPQRFTSRPSNPPCTTAPVTPTANSAMPLSRGPQPKRNWVYSTQVACRMYCARLTSANAAIKPPSPLTPASANSAENGLALASENGERRSSGSDSGRMKKPYNTFSIDSVAAA